VGLRKIFCNHTISSGSDLSIHVYIRPCGGAPYGGCAAGAPYCPGGAP
jgi:hypothetical protein